MKRFVLIASLALFGGCRKAEHISVMPEDMTNECEYRDEICEDAEEFQTRYWQMEEEGRSQMTPVLNSYIENCEDARKMCIESLE